MTDEEIISLYFDRNEEAIQETQRKYDGYCRSVITRILGNPRDAEETLSDVWLKSWLSIPPAHPTELKLYLARIGRNLALNRLRDGRAARRGDRADAVLEELGEVLGGNSTEEAVDANELRKAINRFLRRLPERDCDIFVRRCFYAESPQEIASRYGLRPNTVTVSLHRTRRKLREYLIKEGYL